MRISFDYIRWAPMLNTFRPSEVTILVALALLAEGRQKEVEFRTEDLVAVSGIARLTAQKCLKALAKRGTINILSIRSGAKGTTTVALNEHWIRVGE